jgi:hypothetical protein
MMTRRGRGGSHHGSGGERGRCGRGRGQNYTGIRMAAKSGLCAALSNNVFDYGHRAAADKKGTKQLLVQCQNALYGTMVASLLYYRKFTKSLMNVGFKINPYDPCVANKIVDGTQMTICFHVDDCKLSHRNSRANDKYH